MKIQNSNDENWFWSIVKQFESKLIAYVFHILRNLEKAQEVVQEAFLKLHKQNRAEIQNHVAAWLFTVCRNQAFDVRRKDRLMTTLVEAQERKLQDPASSALSHLEENESESDLWQALSDLPENQQEVIRLKFQSDLSYREISQITKLSESNVGFLIHTGLKTLREKLKGKV